MFLKDHLKKEYFVHLRILKENEKKVVLRFFQYLRLKERMIFNSNTIIIVTWRNMISLNVRCEKKENYS